MLELTLIKKLKGDYMAKKKKNVKRKINKSRFIILISLLLIIVFSILFIFKNTFGTTRTIKTNENGNNTNEASKKESEIEHLSLDNEKTSDKFKILIDPGHGGSDLGTEGVNGVLEKDVCLNIGKKVAGELSQYDDLEVILTRSEDTYISAEDRIKMANSQGVDAVVSIDANAQSNSNLAHGIETYYQANGMADSEKLAKTIQDTISLYLNSKNRGIYPSNLQILKESDMPAVLVEVGFITNEKEAEKLNNNSYQDRMAEGIAQGILRYIDDTKS